ncbi:MAG: PAS domain S-box protein [Myxococcota bacterium]
MDTVDQEIVNKSKIAALVDESEWHDIKGFLRHETQKSLIHLTSINALPADVEMVIARYPNGLLDEPRTIKAHGGGTRCIAWLPQASPGDVDRALQAGFDDVSVGGADLEHRLVQSQRYLCMLNAYTLRVEAFAGLVELIGEMAANPELPNVLRTSIIRMSKLFAIERVSVVLFKENDELGFVITEQNASLDTIVVRISDYPELQEITRGQREYLLISDVFGDSLLSGVRQKLHDAEIRHRSAVLFPLLRKRKVVGALFLRSRQQLESVDERLLSMGRLIAQVTSVAVGNALETDTLLSEHRALLRDKADVDELLVDARPYAEFFSQASDGFLVTDAKGAIRYINPSASAMLRKKSETLLGQNLGDMLLTDHRNTFERALRGEHVGDAHGYVDMMTDSAYAAPITISAALRPLKPEGVLITFRDVTELREIEDELRQTKDFLENLIQSSVDAIIASDVNGRIILFNRAAERLLGHHAYEVVGCSDFSSLFPDGNARDVMQKLRMDFFGGRGRLELMRMNLLSKSGESVPVNMTAASVYEQGNEIATVAIFTDLRERMKMETKLSNAQKQLQLSERQSVAVELAGVAAHELNQPLTSIMGYADLLKRKIPAGDPNRKPIDVICHEADRMAGIVRRIGKITAYKSQTYVGGTKILDINSNEVPEGETDPD